jgi:hypothetical protein
VEGVRHLQVVGVPISQEDLFLSDIDALFPQQSLPDLFYGLPLLLGVLHIVKYPTFANARSHEKVVLTGRSQCIAAASERLR